MAIVSTIDATSLHTVNNTLIVLALNLCPDSDFVRMCSEVENAERKVELLFGAVRKRLRLLPNWLLIFDGFSETKYVPIGRSLATPTGATERFF